MTAPRLATSVRVTSPKGRNITLRPGDDLPEWAVDMIVNPRAWEGGVHPHAALAADPKPVADQPPSQDEPATGYWPALSEDAAEKYRNFDGTFPTAEETVTESEPDAATETDEAESDAPEAEPVTDYEAMTVVSLKAEIKARNEARDEADQVPADGNKADLIAALEADDETAR